MAVLAARELTKVFGSGHTAVRAVDGVDLSLSAGEIVLVKGPSGSGKTTLLSMLGGLMRPTSGEVLIDGRPLYALSSRELARLRAERIGFVFQAFNLLPSLSAAENVAFPARLVSSTRAERRRRAAELLDRLGLADRAEHLPKQLSGGEKQRVAIARALMNEPTLILADEPTGNLDSGRGQEVMMILHDIARDEGRTVLVVTHDPRVEEIADRILWLEDGTLRDRRSEEHVWARDPVCGMRVDAWTAEVVLQAGEQRIVFCSTRCRERFVAAPSAYLTARP